MSRATELTGALCECIQGVPDLQGIHLHTDTLPDGAPLPCALVTIDSDSMVEFVGSRARRARTYSIQVVLRRGATETDLNAMAVEVLRSLEFGQIPARRKMKGLNTSEQDTRYDFAGNGSNLTSVTLLVTYDYVETY